MGSMRGKRQQTRTCSCGRVVHSNVAISSHMAAHVRRGEQARWLTSAEAYDKRRREMDK